MSASRIPPLHAPASPGVLLTFDDAGNIPYWHQAMALFARHGARATFFVDKFDRLSDEAVEMLRDLRAAGHAIGCHSLRHFSPALYARDHGMERYLMTDVEPAIAAMHARGFAAHSFAYPNSRHDDQTDAALLRHFGRLRTGSADAREKPLEACDVYFTPVALLPTQGRLTGCGIDSVNDRPAAVLRPAFTRARRRGEVLTLYAHRIDRSSPGTARLHITQPELEDVLVAIREEGLATHTFDDLPACVNS